MVGFDLDKTLPSGVPCAFSGLLFSWICVVRVFIPAGRLLSSHIMRIRTYLVHALELYCMHNHDRLHCIQLLRFGCSLCLVRIRALGLLATQRQEVATRFTRRLVGCGDVYSTIPPVCRMSACPWTVGLVNFALYARRGDTCRFSHNLSLSPSLRRGVAFVIFREFTYHCASSRSCCFNPTKLPARL